MLMPSAHEDLRVSSKSGVSFFFQSCGFLIFKPQCDSKQNSPGFFFQIPDCQIVLK